MASRKLPLFILSCLLLLALLSSHWWVRSAVFSLAFDIPVARNDISMMQQVNVPMSDGVNLSTLIYFPDVPEVTLAQRSAILIRTPYDQTTPSAAFFAKALAHRGFIVVTQDVRGTGGSEGEFIPLRHEREDGADTLAWLSEQPWFSGNLGLFGMSYLGYTANAMAVDNHPAIKAVFATNATRSFYPVFYGNGGFDLDTALNWTAIVHAQQQQGNQDAPSLLNRLFSFGEEPPALPFDTLPMVNADVATTGEQIPFYQTFVRQTDPEDEYWQATGISAKDIAGISAPVYLASGWYDTLLPQVIADYEALRVANKTPHLVIGDGPHVDTDGIITTLRHAIYWFDWHLQRNLLSEEARTVTEQFIQSPIHIQRMNIDIQHDTHNDGWQTLSEWPIPTMQQTYYFTPDAGLSAQRQDATSSVSSYQFDPANPTPAVGGPLLSSTVPVVNNAPLEKRADTLVFDALPFSDAFDVTGSAIATIYVSSDRPTFDLFVRINRVNPEGESINITDGIQRFTLTPGKVHRVQLKLSPTAFQFQPNEALRVIVASGAHPRMARNTGAGDTSAQALSHTLHVANIQIHHDQNYPSNIALPIAKSALAYDVEDMLNTFKNALEAREFAKIETMLADDFRYQEPGMPVMSKAGLLERERRGASAKPVSCLIYTVLNTKESSTGITAQVKLEFTTLLPDNNDFILFSGTIYQDVGLRRTADGFAFSSVNVKEQILFKNGQPIGDEAIEEMHAGSE